MDPLWNDGVADKDDLVLVTGGTGFIGYRLVTTLMAHGFRNLRCLIRTAAKRTKIDALQLRSPGGRIQVLEGNLLSRDDCYAATRDAVVIFHLAAGCGEKSFSDAFLNSVVTTRNLLEASTRHNCLRRFVNVSSFAVYTNRGKRDRILDELCQVEPHPELRDPYCFAKVKQDELVTEYGKRFGIPYVIIRPGQVYGAGKETITGRVGIGTFGPFLHLGGSNPVPLTYVDNCADAIALAGLRKGIDGEVFNIVDDDLPSSSDFLRLYKQNVAPFNSIYVPHLLSYVLCSLWERYSRWSQGQLPPTFNRGRWHANWKNTRYSNAKLKSLVGWRPQVSTDKALIRYFESCRNSKQYA